MVNRSPRDSKRETFQTTMTLGRNFETITLKKAATSLSFIMRKFKPSKSLWSSSQTQLSQGTPTQCLELLKGSTWATSTLWKQDSRKLKLHKRVASQFKTLAQTLTQSCLTDHTLPHRTCNSRRRILRTLPTWTKTGSSTSLWVGPKLVPITTSQGWDPPVATVPAKDQEFHKEESLWDRKKDLGAPSVPDQLLKLGTFSQPSLDNSKPTRCLAKAWRVSN